MIVIKIEYRRGGREEDSRVIGEGFITKTSLSTTLNPTNSRLADYSVVLRTSREATPNGAQQTAEGAILGWDPDAGLWPLIREGVGQAIRVLDRPAGRPRIGGRAS